MGARMVDIQVFASAKGPLDTFEKRFLQDRLRLFIESEFPWLTVGAVCVDEVGSGQVVSLAARERALEAEAPA